MKGTNKFYLNESTMIQAVQYFFDNVWFNTEVKVTSITKSETDEFIVLCEDGEG